jgi:hypothetical protein
LLVFYYYCILGWAGVVAAPSYDSAARESEVVLMVRIPDGLAVSLVGVINGAINAIVPRWQRRLPRSGSDHRSDSSSSGELRCDACSPVRAARGGLRWG